jgi:hypothetical protein
MTLDDPTRVTELLDRASLSVSARPEFVARVQAGSRRRLRRRRLAATIQVTAVVVLLMLVPMLSRALSRPAPGPAQTRTEPSWPTVIGTLYDSAPRGDLIGDTAYLDSVVTLWQTSHGTKTSTSTGLFADLRGRPKVVWAGHTAAGPAALVEQRAYWHAKVRVDDTDAGVITLVGFIGVDAAGRPRLVEDTYTDNYVAWYVDPDCTTFVVLDQGKSLGWANGYTEPDNGPWTLDYRPLTFVDGAAVVTPTTPRELNSDVTIGLLPNGDLTYGIAGKYHGNPAPTPTPSPTPSP